MILITDSHREMYSKLYKVRRDTSIGFNILNITKIQLANELVELGYLSLVKTRTFKEQSSKGLKEFTYTYYESTGKKMPNKKFSGKRLKKLLADDGYEIRLELAQKPQTYNRYWSCGDLTINGIKFPYDISSNKFKQTIYFHYSDDRWYKFSVSNIPIGIDYETLFTHNKITLDRLKKFEMIFAE